jgi:hypothetical protein
MRRTVFLGLVLAAVLAGCGGGSSSNGEAKKTADQVVADARRAALGAKVVHVTGAGVDNGQKLGLDLWLGHNRGKGHLTQAGAGFDVIRIGDTIYVKGSDAFLRKFAGAQAATLLHGRWLKGSATGGQLAAVAPLTDLEQFFEGTLGQHGRLVNKGETEFKGDKVVEIRDTTQGGSLYVAATGTPYPVALAGGKNQGDVSFGDWGSDVTIEAPQGAIDLGALGK